MMNIALDKGKAQRKRLVHVVRKAVKSSPTAAYPHTYIYSPPGLGKTYTVNESLKEAGVPFFELSGAVSMFAFGVSLAVINFIWCFVMINKDNFLINVVTNFNKTF